jgi:hypothetical protein
LLLFYAYFLNICISYESSHIIFSKVSVAGRREKRLSGVECKNFFNIYFFLFYAYFLNICISYESSHIIFSKVSVAGRREKRLSGVECKNFYNIYFFSFLCVFSKYMHIIWELAYYIFEGIGSGTEGEKIERSRVQKFL